MNVLLTIGFNAYANTHVYLCELLVVAGEPLRDLSPRYLDPPEHPCVLPVDEAVLPVRAPGVVVGVADGRVDVLALERDARGGEASRAGPECGCSWQCHQGLGDECHPVQANLALWMLNTFAAVRPFAWSE